MTYTQLALVGVLAVLLVDTVVLRTWLIRRRTYWVAYAIVLFFQLVTNGILTGFDIVRYDPAAILGLRIVFAPVEDLLFGWAMVTLTLCTWVWLGRREARRARPGGPGTGSGRPAARPRPAPPSGPTRRR